MWTIFDQKHGATDWTEIPCFIHFTDFSLAVRSSGLKISKVSTFSPIFQFCGFFYPFSVCSHPVESYLFKRPNLQNWLNNRNLRVLHSHKIQPLPRHVVCIKIGVCVLWVKPSYMNDLKRNSSSEVVIFIGATYMRWHVTRHSISITTALASKISLSNVLKLCR